MSHFSTVIRQKVNTLLDKFEDPIDALDCSYVKQLEMLSKLRKSLAEIVTSRKRLEMQKANLGTISDYWMDRQEGHSMSKGRT